MAQFEPEVLVRMGRHPDPMALIRAHGQDAIIALMIQRCDCVTLDIQLSYYEGLYPQDQAFVFEAATRLEEFDLQDVCGKGVL